MDFSSSSKISRKRRRSEKEREDGNVATKRKLKASRPVAKATDIYVTREKSKQSAFRQRGLKLLKKTENEQVVVHALGAAIPNACEIALWICENMDPVETSQSIETGSHQVVDHVINKDSSEFTPRPVSSIKITISRKD